MDDGVESHRAAVKDPSGKGTTRRPFGLLDGLILLVPVAIGFALSRPRLAVASWDPFNEWASRWRGIIDFNLNVASRFVSVAMLGLLVVRLRHPRPGLRRLSRQPGTVACTAAALAMAAGGTIVGTMRIFRESRFSEGDASWITFEPWIAPAVMISWAALFLGRRWRAEPSWIDRAGRCCGCYWIVAAIYRGVVLTIVGDG
jgi:hypothetical protein